MQQGLCLVPLRNALFSAIFALIGALPLSWVRGLGTAIGRVMWWSNGRQAKVTRLNIELCFPELSAEERRHLARDSLAQTGQSGLELIKVWRQSNARTAAAIQSVRRRELYDAKLASDRGLLLLVPHLGNWEVVGLWCAQHREMTALYQPPKQALLEPMVKRARERMGNKLYPTDARGVRAVLKALKGKGITAILPDQEPDLEGGSYAPFFGIEALTMNLVHGLLTRTDCEVLMAFAQRVPGGWDIVFKQADPDIGHADRDTAVAALNRSVESCVRSCPEQYQWEYKRFKKRSTTTEKRYKF